MKQNQSKTALNEKSNLWLEVIINDQSEPSRIIAKQDLISIAESIAKPKIIIAESDVHLMLPNWKLYLQSNSNEFIDYVNEKYLLKVTDPGILGLDFQYLLNIE